MARFGNALIGIVCLAVCVGGCATIPQTILTISGAVYLGSRFDDGEDLFFRLPEAALTADRCARRIAGRPR